MEALTTLTDDALLVEESTMDPLSPLPSFVEMLLVQQAAGSGRSALSAAVAALAASGEGGAGGGSNSGDGDGDGGGVLRRMGLFLHLLFARIASRYGAEVCALLTYAVERRCLASESSGGATAAEAVYGMTRSRWSTTPPPPPPPLSHPESHPGPAPLPDDGGKEGALVVSGGGIAIDDGAAGKSAIEEAPLAPSGKTDSSAGIAKSRAADEHPEEGGGHDTSAAGYLAPLSDGDRVRSALAAALGPYVKDKLDRAFERTRDDLERERMLQTPSSPDHPPLPHFSVRRNRWKRVAREAFVRSYPYVHLAWEGVASAYQFAYLLGRTAHFTPSLHALGLIVRRVTMEDLQQRQRQRRSPQGTEKEATTAKTPGDSSPGASSTSPPSATTTRQSPIAASPHLVRRVRAAAVGGAAALLLFGWAVQVRAELRRRRRRRIADSERRRRERDGVRDGDDDGAGWSLPPPVPPAIPTGRGDGGGALVPLPPDPGSCPLCLRSPRVNPSAAPSGYVFCYRCLVGHVRDAAAGPSSSSSSSSSSPSCPVTGVPCPEDRILRLFETHER